MAEIIADPKRDTAAVPGRQAPQPPPGSDGESAASEAILLAIVQWTDLALVAVAAMIAHVANAASAIPVDFRDSAIAAMAGVAVAVHVLQRPVFRTIDGLRALRRQIREVTLAWCLIVGVVMLGWMVIGAPGDLLRAWGLAWFYAGLALLWGSRIISGRLIQKWTRTGRLVRHVVILGAGELGQRFVDRLVQTERYGARIVGIFDDRKDRVPNEISGMPVRGRSDDLVAFVRRNRADMVVVALPLSAELRMLEIVHKLRQLPIDMRVLTDFVGFHVPNRPVSYLGGIPLINVFDKPIKDWKAVAKKLEDLALGLLALVLLAPVFALVALAIKLDSPGPVLFRQKRFGFNNKLFDVYKFRTMRADMADPLADKLVTRHDPRVTRVGAFLRRTSLDELPQIINVLKGEMSLVGPRPHALNAKAADQYYHEVVADYAARHRVKPGITGWAQINGWRGETDTLDKIHGRVECDLYYIDHWSVWLDLWIIALTVIKGVTGKNAY